MLAQVGVPPPRRPDADRELSVVEGLKSRGLDQRSPHPILGGLSMPQ